MRHQRTPLRGQIWLADVGLDEAKRFVIVSNNVRNRKLNDLLGIRLTTAPKPDLPSIVAFGPGEVARSRCFAVADDIWPLAKVDLVRSVGALTPRKMEAVQRAIAAALDL